MNPAFAFIQVLYLRLFYFYFSLLNLIFFLQGAKQNFNRAKEAEENAGLSSADSPACSNSFASQSQVASQSMDAESPISGQISEYEDAETGLAVSLSSFCIICTKYTLTYA
jgi:hypothetical protein